MTSFEQFKRKPLTREKLEEKSRGVKKTGEILSGMKDAEQNAEKEPMAPLSRNERLLQSLENEIREIKNYAQTVPGYAELQDLKSRAASLSPIERQEASRSFNGEFPGARKEIEEAAQGIRERQERIRKIKEKQTGTSPFADAA